MPIRRSAEFSIGINERPRNDTTNPKSVGMMSRDPANLVQLFQRNDFFVRRDLQNGIGRSVKDGISGFDMLGAKLFQYGGTAAGIVADEFYSRFPLDRIDQFVGES